MTESKAVELLDIIRKVIDAKRVGVYRFEIEYFRNSVSFVVTGRMIATVQQYYENLGWFVYREGADIIWFIREGISVVDVKSTDAGITCIDMWIRE